MLDNLTQRLSKVVKTLRGQARLTEENIQEAMREVRMALLEADVALPVVKDFVARVKEKAVGQEVIGSLTPGQALVGVVHDELKALMGGAHEGLDLSTQPPAVVLMAGLQGAGKTTTTGKLAKLLHEEHKKKVLVVSADVYRPAAIEQLKTVAAQAGVGFFPSSAEQKPVDIALAALDHARKHHMDVLLVDTAGRLAVDEAMMAEIKALHAALKPVETLFVVDAMQGQDAVNVARAFNEALPLTGVVLTKLDGDARGGAALSVKEATGAPILFSGVGETTDKFEEFRPEGMASRILGMGDVVGLVERAAENLDAAKMAATAEKMRKGSFDLSDLREQLEQMAKLGGMSGLMGMMPGVAKMKNQMANMNLDDGLLKRQKAIIDSMTPKERRNPDLLKASRKRRISAGSGAKVEEINRLLKMHRQMADVMKSMSRGKGGGMLAGLGNMLGMGPGMGAPGGKMPSQEEIQKLAEKMPDAGKLPAQFPGLSNMPSKFPGLPGLGGVNPLKKK